MTRIGTLWIPDMFPRGSGYHLDHLKDAAEVVGTARTSTTE